MSAADDFKELIEKISKEKDDRNKGLEELRRRKKQLEKFNPDRVAEPYQALTPKRQTLSSERRDTNHKIYEHLLSPPATEIKKPKLKFASRIEEEAMEKRVDALNIQKNRLRMLDKRARYAGIVREIFSPTIDPLKKEEVQRRIEQDALKTRSAYNSRGNSLERDNLNPIDSYQSYKDQNVIKNAGKNALESPRYKVHS